MTYYWTVFLIILICCSFVNQKNNKLVLFFCVFLVFAFIGFRIGFTPDYYNYEDAFEQFHFNNYVDERFHEEIGFQWLCQILPSYRSLLVLFSLFYCSCLYIALSNIPYKYWYIAFFIVFCYQPFLIGNMSGMRSGFVTCFFFLAILAKKYYGLKGTIIGVALILLSAFLHKAALVLIPLMLIPTKPFGKAMMYILYILAGVFIVLGKIYPDLFNQLGLLATTLFFSDTAYEDYFKGEIESAFSLFSIMKTVVLAILFYVTLSESRNAKNEKVCVYLNYTAFFYVLVLAPAAVGMITRFYYHFVFPCIIASCFVIDNTNKDTKTLYKVCIFIYAFWQMYNLYTHSSILPYLKRYDSILF